MFNKYLYLIFLLTSLIFTPSQSNAQSVDTLKVDTLIDVLTLQKEDVRTVNAYLSLAEEYLRVSDYTVGLTYADLAKELADKIDYKNGQLDANLIIADIYLNFHSDFKKSIKHFDNALELAEELNSEMDKLKVYQGYSLNYAYVKNYPLALSFNEKAISIAEEMEEDQLLSDLNAYGGGMYEESGDTARAIEMYQEVERIENERNFLHTSFASLIMIAHYYFLEGDIEKSLQMYRSAITRFERHHDFRWTSYGHAEIAKVHLADNNFEVAEKHALAGLEIAQKFSLNKERGDNYHALSLVYNAKGDKVNQSKYEKAYHALLDSVIIDLKPRAVEEITPNDQSEKSGLYSQFKSLIVILILTGLVVFLSGFLGKKR